MIQITCRQMVEVLQDYVSGELSVEHAQHVQIHLQACPPCVAFVESYKVTISISQKLPQQPIPDSLQQRLAKAMEELKKQS